MDVALRPSSPIDGAAVFKLIGLCPPLDTNSMYCNLLQCTHFAATSVIAEADGDALGFISGYLIPSAPNTLFIWQVAVSDRARGIGLATRMLRHILDRPHCQDVSFLETTITEDNQASWALFNGLAKKLNAESCKSGFFDRHEHFENEHDTEWLFRIGPFNAKNPHIADDNQHT